MMGYKRDEFDVVVDTNGHCFLCLERIINNDLFPPSQFQANCSDSAIYPLQCLSRYLGMSSKNENDHKIVDQKKTARLKVSLCKKCGCLSDQFRKKYEQLQKIQMELVSCMELIYEKLLLAETTGKTMQFRKLMGSRSSKSGNDFIDGRKKNEVKNMEGLRLDITRKCSRKLKQLPPRVKLLNLSHRQVKRATKRRISFSKPKSKEISRPTSLSKNEVQCPGKKAKKNLSPAKKDGHSVDIGDEDVPMEGSSFGSSVGESRDDEGDDADHYDTDMGVYATADHRKAMTGPSGGTTTGGTHEMQKKQISSSTSSPKLTKSKRMELLGKEYNACQRKMSKLTIKLFGPRFKPPTKEEMLRRKQEFLRREVAYLKKQRLKEINKKPVKAVRTPSFQPSKNQATGRAISNLFSKLNKKGADENYDGDNDDSASVCKLCTDVHHPKPNSEIDPNLTDSELSSPSGEDTDSEPLPTYFCGITGQNQKGSPLPEISCDVGRSRIEY